MSSYVDQASVRLDAQENISTALKRVQAEISATITRATQIRGVFAKAFDGVRARINGIASGIGSIGGKLKGLGTGLTVLGGADSAGLGNAFIASADAAESVNRFRAIFGDQADAADDFAARLAKAIRRSKTELIGALGDFGGFASGLGLSQEATRAMSEELTALSQDLGSFNNLSTGDAITKLLAAMSGEAEPVKRLGIDISATALKLRGIGEDATQTAKAMARLEIIRETLGRQGAIGDAEKTAFSASNSIKALGSAVLDFKIAVGEGLASANGFVNGLVEMVRKATDWVKLNPGLVAAIAAGTIGVTGLGVALVVTGSALSAVATIITTVTAVAGALLTPIGLVTAVLVGVTAAVFDFKKVGSNIAGPFLESWSSILLAVQNGDIQSAFELVTLEMRRAWLEMLDEMKFRWLLFKYNVADAVGLENFVDVHGALAQMDAPLKAIETQIQAVQERIKTGAAEAAQKMKDVPKLAADVSIHHVIPKFAPKAQQNAVAKKFQPRNMSPKFTNDPLSGIDLSALKNDLPRGFGGAMERVIQQLDGLSLRSQESVSAFVQAANGARVDAIDRQTAVLEQMRDLMADNPEMIGKEVGDAIDSTTGVVGLNRT